MMNFALRSMSTCFFQYTVKSYDMGQMALLPLRRKACCGFLLLLKIHLRRPGFDPRILGPMASTLTTRPSRMTYNNLIRG